MVCIPTATKEKDLVEHLCKGVTYLSTQLQYGTNQLESGQRRNNNEVEASHLEATSESRFRNCLAGRS